RLVAGDGTRHTVRLAGPVTAPVVVTDDGELPAQVRRHGHWATVTIDGVGRSFTAVVGPDGVQLNREGALFDLRRERTDHGVDTETTADPTLVSPMPGTVLLTYVADGAMVAEG